MAESPESHEKIVNALEEIIGEGYDVHITRRPADGMYSAEARYEDHDEDGPITYTDGEGHGETLGAAVKALHIDLFYDPTALADAQEDEAAYAGYSQ